MNYDKQNKLKQKIIYVRKITKMKFIRCRIIKRLASERQFAAFNVLETCDIRAIHCVSKNIPNIFDCNLKNKVTISPFFDSSIDNVILQTNPDLISRFLNP